MDGRHERCFICNDPTHRAGEDSIYIGVSGIGPWCDSCYQDMVQEVEGDARAEERALAANATADPALLALARFGAGVAQKLWLLVDDVGGGFDDAGGYALDRMAIAAGIMMDADYYNPSPGIAAAIARLLAPDGAGEVAP